MKEYRVYFLRNNDNSDDFLGVIEENISWAYDGVLAPLTPEYFEDCEKLKRDLEFYPYYEQLLSDFISQYGGDNVVIEVM